MRRLLPAIMAPACADHGPAGRENALTDSAIGSPTQIVGDAVEDGGNDRPVITIAEVRWRMPASRPHQDAHLPDGNDIDCPDWQHYRWLLRVARCEVTPPRNSQLATR